MEYAYLAKIRCRNYVIIRAAANRILSGIMIGHLQRNKVKYIVDKVELIHSVDFSPSGRNHQ